MNETEKMRIGRTEWLRKAQKWHRIRQKIGWGGFWIFFILLASLFFYDLNRTKQSQRDNILMGPCSVEVH